VHYYVVPATTEALTSVGRNNSAQGEPLLHDRVKADQLGNNNLPKASHHPLIHTSKPLPTGECFFFLEYTSAAHGDDALAGVESVYSDSRVRRRRFVSFSIYYIVYPPVYYTCILVFISLAHPPTFSFWHPAIDAAISPLLLLPRF
jgi:hypothetical protein